MKKLKKIISVLLMLTIVLTLVPSQNVQAAVKLNKKSISLEYHNYTNLKVTGTSKKVTWKSSNKNVVTVNSKGKLFASGVGTAYVSAKVGNKTYKCKVKTFKKDLTAFDLDLYNTISIGDTICVIKIASTPSYYTTADLTYTSSNSSVATVDNNGFVHGVSAGTAVITATYGSLSQSMNITVKSNLTLSDSDLDLYAIPAAGLYGFIKNGYTNVSVIGGYYRTNNGASHRQAILKVRCTDLEFNNCYKWVTCTELDVNNSKWVCVPISSGKYIWTDWFNKCPYNTSVLSSCSILDVDKINEEYNILYK